MARRVSPLAIGLACGLLLLFASLSIWEMTGDSVTVDERVHLPAGYAYWLTGDFRLNSEHPPFVKLICAAPLLAFRPPLPPIQPPPGMTYHRFMGPFGTRFFYGQDIDRLMFWGRLPAVVLGCLLGALVFHWSWRLHGHPRAGLLSTALFAFEPTLLAHSHYVTTDVPLAAFGVMAFFYLWRFCEEGGQVLHLGLAVLGMGLALASKFSAVVFVPVFFVLLAARWPARAAADRKDPAATRSRWRACILALLGLVVIVQAFYFFSPDLSLYLKGIQAVRENRPANYPAYAFGTFHVGGVFWYPLYVYLLKTPLPTLVFVALAAAGLLGDRTGSKPLLLFLLLPAGLYTAAVCFLADNYGVRYMIPVMSFLIVLAGRAHSWLAGRRAGRAVTALLLLWLPASVLRVSPHFLAYANELIGGPENAARFMHDSNLDWGQDAKRLARYEEENDLGEIVLAYWGPLPPDFYGVRYRHWSLRSGDTDGPPPQADPVPPGVYAISVNQLVNLKKRVLLDGEDPKLDWLERFRPADRVGYSIYIYRFPPAF
jgi:hypothetical protein